MKVKDLVPKAAVDELIVTVVSKSETRDVKGGMLRVADCDVKDETGNVKLTLWNDDINKVNTGDQIKITKGWVNEYQGAVSVSSGKFGKIEVLAPGKGGSVPLEVKEAYDNDII